MKAITYKVSAEGGETEVTALVPANRRETARVDKAGLAIAGGLLFLTLAFVGGIVLALLR